MTYKGAIKQLYEMRDNIWMPEFFKPYFDKIIETLTDDVRENVRGEWQKVDEQPYFRKHFHKVCCSVCRKQGYDYWNFCPNCGAQMIIKENR